MGQSGRGMLPEPQKLGANVKSVLSNAVRTIAGVGALSLLLSGTAGAQNYPAHPVRFIVPFSPAGPTDVFARLLAEKLTTKLGQKFYVENQAAAAG
jgi:tripartite-type tricarboxylate transporter receptor subunit TctC